jgi:hypothetical protein
MKRPVTYWFCLLLGAMVCGCMPGCDSGSDSGYQEPTPEELEKLARCLTEKGWVIYGTTTCSGCRATRKNFGDAWQHINYVECDPYETDTQAERCLEKKIRKTPTWILEVDGKELQRLEMYQLLEDLARIAECKFPTSP